MIKFKETLISFITQKPFLFIFFLAVLTRGGLLVYILLTRPDLFYYSGHTDYPKYYQLAINVLTIGEYSQYGYTNNLGTDTTHTINTVVPYGYPVFLAVIMGLGGSHLVVLFLHAVSGILLILFTYKLTILLFDKNIALISALICIFDYQLWFYSTSFWMESLFTMLLVLALWSLFKYTEETKVNGLIVSCVAIALATLFRTVTVFLPLFLAIFIFKSFRNKKFSLLVIVLWSIAIYGTIAFWIIHKSSMTGKKELYSTLRIASSEQKEQSINNLQIIQKKIQEIQLRNFFLTFFGVNGPIVAQTFNRSMENRNFLKPLFQGDYITAWNNFKKYTLYDWCDWIFQVSFISLIYLFFFIGIYYTYKYNHWKPRIYLLSIIIAYALLILIVSGERARYRVPILPFLYILSAYGLVRFRENRFLFRQRSK